MPFDVLWLRKAWRKPTITGCFVRLLSIPFIIVLGGIGLTISAVGSCVAWLLGWLALGSGDDAD